MVGEWIEQVTSCGLVLYWRMTKCPDGFRSGFRPNNQVMKRAFLQRSRPRIIAGIIHLPTLLSEIPLVLPPSSDLVPDHMQMPVFLLILLNSEATCYFDLVGKMSRSTVQ
ncbi:hypothetical protein MGG_17882 [Pyricularia oryzae 70-15]|uniref:Uncharacterized protein n=1 Tax=Pyricularia oryzae (strain 70-15 / ATCC MYA-4617 / FGSC 8958) TaxID=242507 RepID=G4NKS7_PYRO7|nr:uncharacterized protein MGG_17882 [Pyricularia oryzae 70-15]EHA45905.1 hypothetical protein MGG_17882 [Pyricularia oryzae 70-15]